MIGAAKKRCEPSLFQRRAAANPTLNPLPKLFVDQRSPTRREDEGVGPDPTFRKEIIADGIDQGVQVRHSSRGKPWNHPRETIGTRYYYTQGPVPGMIRPAKAHQGPFDRVIVNVYMNFDNVLACLLSVSPSLRQAVRNPDVKRVSTNFFPITVTEGDGKRFCTSIYIQPSMSVYPHHFTDVVLYPATLSFDKSENEVKCRLGVVPTTSDEILLRPFQTTDYQEEVCVSHISQLLEVFKDKWQRKAIVGCDANGIDKDEIDSNMTL